VAGQKRGIDQLRGTVVSSGLQQVAGGTDVGNTYGGTIFGSASSCQPATAGVTFQRPRSPSAQAGWQGTPMSQGGLPWDATVFGPRPSRSQQGGRRYSSAPACGSGRGRGRRPQGNLPRDVCARCLRRGHWKAQCTVAGYRPDNSGGNIFGSAADAAGAPDMYGGGTFNSYPANGSDGYDGEPGSQPNFVHMFPGNGRAETYVDITVKGRGAWALFDSGCEVCLCPLRMCRNAKITPARTELCAANLTPISVVGTTRLLFKIHDRPYYANVYVTEDVDEFILGLRLHGAQQL